MSDIALKHDGWVVVADGQKALFLYNAGDATYPNLQVFRELEHDNPPTREQGSDRPGRYNDAGGVNRSAVEDTDWHRIEKERFAREIAERLHRAAQSGRFDKLVIVAPPVILGDLRKELHRDVSDRVVAEIAKDLTNHPIDRIEALILRNAA